MKRLILALAFVVAAGCASHTPPGPPNPDPLATLHADAKKALDALNAASTISVTALGVARSIPSLPPATVTAIADAVRAYNCALLDDGNPAPMPPPATGTVSDSCHAHHDPMLGIITKISAVGSAASLHALVLQGLTYADQALATLSASSNADLVKFAEVARAALAVIRSLS